MTEEWKSDRAKQLIERERRDRRFQILAVFVAGVLFGMCVAFAIDTINAW